MCNIAAYVGQKEAAPIILNMLRIQEGFNAGYFTGVVTHSTDGFHVCKTIGDMRTLDRKLQGLSMKGTIGLAHGRTPGGGDSKWSHPFLGKQPGSDIHLAYVANGSIGTFSDQLPNAVPVANDLTAHGYPMDTAAFDTYGHFNIASGEAVHISDVYAQQTCRLLDEGLDEQAAMEAAFRKVSGEWVGLMLSREHPDRIHFLRWNKPMFVAYAPHGAYMASCPLAFPEDAGEPFLLPAGSVGWVSATGHYAQPFTIENRQIAPIDASIRVQSYDCILNALRESEKTIPQLADSLIPLFEKGACTQRYTITYDVVTALYREKKINMENRDKPGMTDGLLAPCTYFTLRD